MKTIIIVNRRQVDVKCPKCDDEFAIHGLEAEERPVSHAAAIRAATDWSIQHTCTDKGLDIARRPASGG